MTPTPGASAALCRRLVPDLVGAGAERPIDVDQTNRSVVVDEALIVKWFVPPVPAPHPGIAMLTHLRAVGFEDMPAFHAAEEVDGHVVAMISEHVPGAVDGWRWFVDELVAGDLERVLASAGGIGVLAARMHVALAPAATGVVEVAGEVARCRSLLHEALAVATGEAAQVLRARAARIGAIFDGAPREGETAAIPIHGDLHVGQVLRAGDRLVVTDFDGNPLLDPARRHVPRPAAVDVASLVQSIEHAGRVAQRRSSEVADDLIERAGEKTLSGHRSALAAAGRSDLLDERLLEALRVGQELHELVYAAKHLPTWAHAPMATLRAMFVEP